MKLLVTGKNGQLGRELSQVLTSIGEVVTLDRGALDLSRPDSMRAAISSVRPDVIVNAAAYTAVDAAESEPGVARAINATGPAVLAEQARSLDSLLIHYSTDYVFDGGKDAPYTEDDAPNPLGVYGQTKWEGEQAILASGCRHLIFRTSWVYSPNGRNFLLTMLRLLREKPQISVVNDQIGAPTSARFIATATAQVLTKLAGPSSTSSPSGLFHLTASGETSWWGFARLIAEASGQTATRIEPIPSSAYPTAARRPLNSRLDCSRMRSCFAVELPPWEVAVKQVVTLAMAAAPATVSAR